ncbi:Crp/Fnr family transcriptional regulator [Ferruginibacter sp. HRS2-29]|uniref:Crp/Fnr family transcriptional regulator n=1 Tax=Ferruginibacter sp. HRS2-29 TaxID=2487334 RepID=UPI0020CD75DA|nr:Crp/Fnr family transcriptional regulator [Ferruginibacter sp. HRS2-29]MCP9750085.1 Crp/Fnr family transcriptional regulator [Ferruginibacter sp. HRS2-29]
MLTPLIQYITRQSQTPLSEEDIQLIEKAFIPKKLKKREFLLQEGEICRYITFIAKGATRQYVVDDKGKEHITNLSITNWWVSDRESFHEETPSIYNIDAWQDCEVLLLPKANGWYDKVNTIPTFCEMRKRLDDTHHIATQKRLHSSIVETAEHRYRELEEKYPEFFLHFPLHIIASYLGITKETLSRIRKHGMKKV